MTLLLLIDAFCVGLFIGALIVKLDVTRIAEEETLKALRKYRK